MRLPVTPRPSYRRRLAIGAGEFVRLTVFENREDFLAYARAKSSDPIPSDAAAVTLHEPNEGVLYSHGGCVAEIVFTWRTLVLRQIAHESAHAALAAIRARGLDVHEDRGAEEKFAGLVDEIFHAITSRTI